MSAGDRWDLLVAGGGVTGAMIAHRAREAHPEWRVLVVDRSLSARATTQFSPGHNHPHGLDAGQRALAEESIRYFDALKARIPELPLHDRPMFSIVSEERLDAIIAGYVRPGMRRATAEELDALRGFYPGLSVAPHQAVITGALGGHGFPQGIAQVLLSRLSASGGADLYEGTEVTGIEAEGDGQRVHTRDGRRLSASRVVLAAGPFLPELLRPHFDSAPLRIKKVVAMHVHLRPPERTPILYLFDDDSYLLPAGDRGQFVFSFPSREWDCGTEVSRLAISADDRAVAGGILSKYLPSFAERIHGGRVFFDAYTADRLPLVVRIPGLPRAVAAGGGSGYGFRLSPAVASRALRLLDPS